MKTTKQTTTEWDKMVQKKFNGNFVIVKEEEEEVKEDEQRRKGTRRMKKEETLNVIFENERDENDEDEDDEDDEDDDNVECAILFDGKTIEFRVLDETVAGLRVQRKREDEEESGIVSKRLDIGDAADVKNKRKKVNL